MKDINYFLDPYNWSFGGLMVVLLLLAVYLLFFKTNLIQKILFTFALVLIYLVLGSPIADLTNFGLHSVSMLQHIVLLMVAPILLLKAFPLGILKRSNIKNRSIFSNPRKYFIVVWILSAIVMWGGHFLSAAILSSKTGTAICGIAFSSRSWITNIPGDLIFGILLMVGLLFTLPVLHPDPSKRLSPIQSVIYLFTACISCSLLGLYVAFSASSASMAEAVPVFTTLRNPIPMSIRTDQEMAGMLMWVPGCVLYVVTSVEIMLHWYDANPDVKENTTVQIKISEKQLTNGRRD